MNTSQFSTHRIWGLASDALTALGEIEVEGGSESENVSRVETILLHLKSFSGYQGEIVHLFVPRMLDQVAAELEHCVSYVQGRKEQGKGHPDYLLQAVNHAEEALYLSSNWPVPSAKGVQVRRLRSLFEDVADAQAKVVESFSQREEALGKSGEEAQQLLDEAKEAVQETTAEMQSKLDALEQQVEDVLKAGRTKVEELEALNRLSFEAWKKSVGTEARARMSELVSETAGAKKEAVALVLEVKEQAGEYSNVVSASSAALLAGHYAKDADAGRKLGIGTYALGLAIVIAGTVPLVVASVQANGGAVFDFERLLPRIVLALVSGSVAAVFWKLGSRFFGRSEAAKDYELQLRTIGPFLANVSKEKVDEVRLNFVNRKYAETPAIRTHSSSNADKSPRDENGDSVLESENSRESAE